MKMPLPDDWNGEDCIRWAVCWPNSSKWRAILQGLIESPMQYAFWDSSTGHVNTVREQFRPFYIANFDGNEVIMSCNDNGLLQGLQAIANSIVQASATSTAIANSNGVDCCGQVLVEVNGGISGTATQPVGGGDVPIYGTVPPKSIPFGDLPAGFETKEEWDASRCQIAYGLVNGVISTLRVWTGISFGQLVGLGALIIAGIAGAIVFPPAMLGTLVGCLLIIGGITGLLDEMADYIEANKQEFICDLMTGNSIEVVIGLLADSIDTMVAFLDVSSGSGTAIKTAMLLLFNSDSLNALMTKQAHYLYPDADCGECTCALFTPIPETLPRQATTVISETLDSIEVTGGSYTDRVRFDVAVVLNGENFGTWCGPNMAITEWELTSGSVTEGELGEWGYFVYDNTGTEVYAGASLPTLPICGAYVTTISGTANSWRIVVEPCEE